MTESDHPSPIWLKAAYALGTPLIAGAYVRTYGPGNFLWLSDLALGCTALSVLTDRPLPGSMAAVGVLPLELAWTADFLAGGRMMGLAAYMFSNERPAWLRALSLFHLALPPTLIWRLAKSGHDERALKLQTALTWIVLPLTYALTDPKENINWVFGPGRKPQHRLPPLLYLALEMAALPALVFWPTNMLLRRFFRGSATTAPSCPHCTPLTAAKTQPNRDVSSRRTTHVLRQVGGRIWRKPKAA